LVFYRKEEIIMYAELDKLPNYTPDYVVDEVKYHFDKISEGKNDIFTLENAISLVNLAKVNNRVTEEQAKEIKRVISEMK